LFLHVFKNSSLILDKKIRTSHIGKVEYLDWIFKAPSQKEQKGLRLRNLMIFSFTYLLIQDKLLEVQNFLVGSYDLEIKNWLKNESAQTLPKLESSHSVHHHDSNYA